MVCQNDINLICFGVLKDIQSLLATRSRKYIVTLIP
jgi:hypothetical protein